MAEFMIRFLICNIIISGIIGLLLIAKHLFRNSLSARMQYHLWLFLLGLLAMPFIPFQPIGFPHVFSWLDFFRNAFAPNTQTAMDTATHTPQAGAGGWLNDFTFSVSSEAPPIAGALLFGMWAAGIGVMILFVRKSKARLNKIKRSAMLLQNAEIWKLYRGCLAEMKIKKDIPIYSTAFLKSPVTAGYLKPCIYLPLHLISDYNASDMKYMLLHELQHYKHHDALINHPMNLAGVLYWFNPFVWYALKEMRNDKEVACDTSVLRMLDESDYEAYGNTLINFAEKISLTPFPFASRMSGNMKQMKKRIINIASYQKPTPWKKSKGISAFLLTAVMLLGLAPMLSTYAADSSRYQWDSSKENISHVDYSAYFGEFEGSFVLYDTNSDTWDIHNTEDALLRVSPDSTFKIYDALFGLEEGIITPDNSFIAWDKETYPFDAWNADQTLPSAMHASVNWYFQAIDEQLGTTAIKRYIRQIGYGNENLSGDFSTYWLESSLKISPIEQVELLKKFYDNSFDFSPENINAVKDSICLSDSPARAIYGKTGTGRVDHQDRNGWFIGFVETSDNTYFFAANIEADRNATGSEAADITMSILSDLNIWE